MGMEQDLYAGSAGHFPSYFGELPMPVEGTFQDISHNDNIITIDVPQHSINISSNNNVITIAKGVKILKLTISGNNNKINAEDFQNGFTSEIVELNITGHNNAFHIRTTGSLVMEGHTNRCTRVNTLNA